MLKSAEEEQAWSDNLWKSQEAEEHRAQQEQDYNLWADGATTAGGFKMPTADGKWESVTTNASTVLSNKVLNILAAADVKLYIDVEDEKRSERKKIVATEQLANGGIATIDRQRGLVPETKPVLDSLAFSAAIRAGAVSSVWLYEDEDGKVCVDSPDYDVAFMQWVSGPKGLIKTCYRQHVTKEWIEEAYDSIPEDFEYGSPSVDKTYLLYCFCDTEDWKVSCNGKYIAETHHGLGYVPFKISSVGSAPHVQSTESTTTTRKASWRSVFADDRNMYDLDSKMLSILSSKATDAGRTVVAGEFDSGLGDAPEGIQKLGAGQGGGRNVTLMFDKAKGQKFGGLITPPPDEVVERFGTNIQRRLVIGGIDPIASGQMNGSGSGALASILVGQALEFINPFKKCVQEHLVWIAEEMARQFKKGEFESISLDGRDSKFKSFSADIKPADVIEKRFTCELVFSNLRDETIELGNAVTKVKNGLTSKRTAINKLVNDPDGEMDRIKEDLASTNPIFLNDALALYFKDQGNPRMAAAFATLSAIEIDKLIKQGIALGVTPPPGDNGEPLVNPEMMANAAAEEPNTSMRNSITAGEGA